MACNLKRLHRNAVALGIASAFIGGCIDASKRELTYSPTTNTPPPMTVAVQDGDKKLDKAMEDCSGVVAPAIMSSSSGSENGSEKGGGNNDALANMALLGTSASKGCEDELLQAMLLLKSAQQQNGRPAFDDPEYRAYLVSKVGNFLTQTAQQWGLSAAQQATAGAQLQSWISNQFGGLLSGPVGGGVIGGGIVSSGPVTPLMPGNLAVGGIPAVSPLVYAPPFPPGPAPAPAPARMLGGNNVAYIDESAKGIEHRLLNRLDTLSPEAPVADAPSLIELARGTSR